MKIYISLLVLMSFWSNIANAQNTLQYYLANAEQNSPLLQKQGNDKKIIELDLQQYNAVYKSPKIDVNSNIIFAPILSYDNKKTSFQWVSKQSTKYQGYDLGSTNGGQYQAYVSVNQPLFTQNFSDVKQAQTDVSIQQLANSAQLTKAELNQTVTHQFILCLMAQEQTKNAEQMLQTVQAQISQITPLVYVGIYRLTDLKLLEIELENRQLELKQSETAFGENLNALNLLCGINNTSLQTLENIALTLNTQNQSNSIFAKSFTLDSLSLVADQNANLLQYLPKLSAFADAGLNATYLPTPNRLGFSVGINFSWNIFDGHQKRYFKEKTKLQLSNIETDKHYFESQNTIRKQNLLTQINNLDEQIILINKQLSEYNNLLELYKKEISKGLISVLELTTIVKEIAGKQQAKTNIEMSKQIVINAYNYWNF